MFSGEHQLKLLNLTVILYILGAALVFHSLGEFDDQPLRAASSSQQGPSNSHGSHAATPATGAAPAPPDKKSDAKNRGEIRVDLRQLRLASVRRMWNITNQLNILYEANWTELVLAELVDFERQFVESLESLAGQESAELEASAEIEFEGDEKEKEKEKRKEKQQVEASKRRSQADAQRRMKSIKKAFVHALATITTIGSPVQAPHSQLGRLLTILYGSLGIPLLVLTVAKSGRQLALSSLNGLLVLRHYCVALPLHYLCCSCSLFACLRWLSWCCCCCCCINLCCWSGASSKQKCCDSSRAPKLKLVTSTARRRSRRTKYRQAKVKAATQRVGADDDSQLAQCANHRAPVAPDGSSTFAIGFSLPGGSPSEQQKSVRFLDEDGRRAAHGDHWQVAAAYKNQEEDAGETARKGEEEEEEEDSRPSREQASSLLVTSCTILALYLAVGAYYHAAQQDLQLVDALFGCFSMLATSKLPDSFRLDDGLGDQAKDPLGYYKSHFSPNLVDDELAKRANSTQETPGQKGAKSAGSVLSSHEVQMAIDSLYLLIGLNLVSACAQFARLWFDGVAQERLAERCKYAQTGGQPSCNGGPPPLHGLDATPSTSLMGSFERQNPHAEHNNLASCPPASHFHHHYHPSPPPPPPHQQHEEELQHQRFMGSALMGAASPAEPSVRRASCDQINLAELFVLGDNGADGGAANGIPTDQLPVSHAHNPPDSGHSFASSSSSQPRSNNSLCAHHQSAALALQGLQVPGLQRPSLGHEGSQLHLAPASALQTSFASDATGAGSLARQNHQQHRRQASHATFENFDQVDVLGPNAGGARHHNLKIRPSSSSTQLSSQERYGSMNSNMPSFDRHQHHIQPAMPVTNGFGASHHQHNEAELSSPNTLDTNSQTMSSVSSRALAMKPEGIKQFGDQSGRTISWRGQEDVTNGR